jgi:uncharacterized protein (DUF736 family)
MADLLKIGSLWKGNDKNGNEMFSGNVSVPAGVTIDDTHRIVCLFNDRKTAENQPDFQVYVTKNEPQGG